MKKVEVKVEVEVEDWEEMAANSQVSTIDMCIPIESQSISQNLEKSVAKVLKDTSTKTNGSLIYKGTSKTTAWRNLKPAEAVDDRQKLTCFGFTTFSFAANPVTEEIVEYSRSETELINIGSMLPKLEEFTKAVVNVKRDGSKVDSYNYLCYLSISHYFFKGLEGKNVGKASLAAAEAFWKNNKSYRADTIAAWAKEFLR